MAPYVPTNINVYASAFAGAMSGISIPNGAYIIDPATDNYASQANVASAFAAAVDTAWGAPAANAYDLEAIANASTNTFTRGAGFPFNATLIDPNNWNTVAVALVVMVLQGDVNAAGQGIVLPPGVVTLTNLSLVRYVDGATTVPVADRNGNIERPFALTHDAYAAVPANGTVYITPGSYIGDGDHIFTKNTTVIGLGSDQRSGIPFCEIPQAQLDPGVSFSAENLSFMGPFAPTTIVGDATNHVYLNQCRLGAVLGVDVRAFNCSFQSMGDFTQGQFTHCDIGFAGPINITGTVLEFYDCNIQSVAPQSVTFTGAPGRILMDTRSYAQWLTFGFTVVNGTIELVDEVPNTKSAVDLLLGADGPIVFPATVLTGQFPPSSIFEAQIEFMVGIYQNADHTIVGNVNITIQAVITTDAGGVVTVAFNTAPAPSTTLLPAALAGATATVTASLGGFTVSAQRPAGMPCSAWFNGSWKFIKNLT